LYDRILVPVDGSENSNAALEEAIKLAKFTGGKITVMHVYLRWSTAFIDESTQKGLHKEIKNVAKTVLDDAEKIAAVENFNVETLLAEGNAVEEIVKTADSGHFDLIVMGARGVSKFIELVLGSVSRGVLEKATCPVLITKTS
jgi:nucleotide-binding universal stress UspA family protein